MDITLTALPADHLTPGDVIATDSGPHGVTRVERYGSIGYGTKPIVDVYLADGTRRTFEYGQAITVYTSA